MSVSIYCVAGFARYGEAVLAGLLHLNATGQDDTLAVSRKT
ncbi:hypothetical protein [Chitinimonas sp. JJ19]